MIQEDRAHWLRLSFIPTLSDSGLRRLIQHCGWAAAVSDLSVQQIVDCGIQESVAFDVQAAMHAADERLKEAVDHALHWQEAPDHHIITLLDPQYPPLLKEIHDPPPVLYLLGNIDAILRPQIALVGSRACSADGRRNASALATQLVEQGFSVISGLAFGIDTCAHTAAIAAGGISVAVMGTGADSIYPVSNRALARSMQSDGALITELALGSPPRSSHFPRRNRIISGMSLGIVVVEAALRSGSLISARLAMEQGREVFAVPGSIRNPKAKGCHKLIRDGAQLLESIDDILEALAPMLQCHVNTLGSTLGLDQSDDKNYPALTKEERAVLQVIGYDPISVDNIVVATGLGVARLQSLLLSLELKAAIICRSGTYALA